MKFIGGSEVEVLDQDVFEGQQQPDLPGYKGFLTDNPKTMTRATRPQVNIVVLQDLPGFFASDDGNLLIEYADDPEIHHMHLPPGHRPKDNFRERQAKHFFCSENFLRAQKPFKGRTDRYKIMKYGNKRVRYRGKVLHRVALFKITDRHHPTIAEKITSNNNCNATAETLCGTVTRDFHIHLARQQYSKLEVTMWKKIMDITNLYPNPTCIVAYLLNAAMAFSQRSTSINKQASETGFGMYSFLKTMLNGKVMKHTQIGPMATRVKDEMDHAISRMYGNLTASNDAALKRASELLGINEACSPGKKEAYVTFSTGLRNENKKLIDYSKKKYAKSGKVLDDAWAEHWGTVIAKSGNDTIAIENYARGGEDGRKSFVAPIRGLEYYAMYGPNHTWHDTWKHDGFANAITFHAKPNKV